MYTIIGFCGKSGSGKTYIAKKLNEKFTTSYLTSFSKPLKNIIKLSGLTNGVTEDQETIFKKLKQVTLEKLGSKLATRVFLKYEKNDVLKNLIKSYISSDKFGKVIAIRKIYQYFGTEMCRDEADSDIWINLLKKDIEDYIKSNPNTRIVFIDDVRFINEADYIKGRGGSLIKVKGRNVNNYPAEILNHISETELDSINKKHFYTIVENDYTDKVISKILHFIDRLIK